MPKILLFFLVSINIYAQNKSTVSGYIKDATNGEPLIGVSIYVKELQQGTVTNPYGFYSVTLPNGNYTFVVSYIGYEKNIEKVSLTTNKTLTIELSESRQQLKEVKIMAKKEDDNVKKIEMSVNTLDIKTIQKMPALFGEIDVIKSIQLLPGVTNVGEGTTGFNVRGGNTDQNLVLLDEAPVYNSSHLFGLFSVFNPDAVKDVKLIKGGIPAQYGGRLSSILDIRMKEGNNKHLEVNGGIGTIFSRISIEAPLVKDKGSFIVAARRSYIDVLAKPFLTSELKSAVFYFYDLTLKANYKINDKNNVYLSGYFGRDVFGQRFGFDWGNGTATARWNHVFNQKLFLNTTVYYSNYDYSLQSDIEETNTQDSFRWRSKIISWSIKPEFTYYLTPKTQLNFGVQSIFYDFTPGEAVAISGGQRTEIKLDNKKANETAFYIGNEQELSNRITLQYGLRYSMYWWTGPNNVYSFSSVPAGQSLDSKKFPKDSTYITGTIADYQNFEPRISLKYQINGDQSVKLSFNRMAQYIHLLSNTAATSPLDVWNPSTRVLKPQLADQIAVGFFKNFGKINSNDYEFSVEGYYKWLQNQVEYTKNSNLLLNRYFEGDLLFGEGRAFGLEFFLKKNVGKLTGWLSYTLSRTERKFTEINRGDWFPTRYDRPHNLNIVATYTLNPRWSFSSIFTYTSGTPTTLPTSRYYILNTPIGNNANDARNDIRIFDYHRLDLSATLTPRKKIFKKGQGEWVFSCYNVYGRRNAYSIYTQPSAETLTDGTRKSDIVQLSIFGSFIPAITYNFKF